jgi:hypothetical protein
MRNPRAIAAIVAILVLAGMRGAASAGLQAGEVLALFGQCSVEAGGGRKPLKQGDAVHVGETLEVATGAKLRLRMNDGSVITIASGGRLTIADYRVSDGGESRDATVSLGEGLLRAVVATLKGAPGRRGNRAALLLIEGHTAPRQVEIDIEAAQGVGSKRSIQRPGQGVHDLDRRYPNSLARHFDAADREAAQLRRDSA